MSLSSENRTLWSLLHFVPENNHKLWKEKEAATDWCALLENYVSEEFTPKFRAESRVVLYARAKIKRFVVFPQVDNFTIGVFPRINDTAYLFLHLRRKLA